MTVYLILAVILLCLVLEALYSVRGRAAGFFPRRFFWGMQPDMREDSVLTK